MLSFLLWSIVFGVSYTQPALYYSNQNQYFLHGLAHGDCGFLQDDWLANTADPAPVFSGLVAFTYRHLSEAFFYVYYLLVLGVYFHALVGIFSRVSGRPPTGLMRLGFIAIFVALHSALLRWTSAQLFGVDYPWYLQAGVANQYLLGAGLQPSVFGVLLLLSIYTFLQDRPLAAVTASSLAAVLHSTYLLSAALLTLSYLYILGRDKRFREVCFTALLALVIVAPVLAYNLRTFAPSSSQAFAESQHLLAHFRLPHHAEPILWFDGIACAQVIGVLVALFLVRGHRLFPILALPFTLSLVLTLVQMGTGNDTLALLFPWRTSAILVPLATTIVLARLMNTSAVRFHPPTPVQGRVFQIVCGVLLAVFVAGGAAINYFDLGYRTNTQELALLEYIREHKAEGDVYLLPVEVPKLTSREKGAASRNFTPPPRRSTQNQDISVDLQRFRLFTGAPIFIDFKSIPYKDVEVLEWHERVLWNHKLYEQRNWNAEQIEAELTQRHITHVVATTDRAIHCDALTLVHEDANYRLYRLRASPE
ncbi:MAG TPA: DUF6798 domain-containing protein [Gemmataceae bacterium]|nr:DUF6798 domain-containing protein [Gemmataceae bacterium]